MVFLRIRFVIPKHYSFFLEDNRQLTLKLKQGTITFSISAFEASIYRVYSLKSNDFDFIVSQETIQKTIDSLYLLCLELDIGLLINPELHSSWVDTKFITELIPDKRINIENDFFGVKLVPTGSIFIDAHPCILSSNSSINSFEHLLNKYIGLNYKKSERLIRAIEIYNSSNYLTIVNLSGQFILLMSAVEALIEPTKVSNRLQNSIDSYTKRIKNLKIEDEERDSILGSLISLKKISIKRSGKNLVESLFDNEKRYNGFSPASFFSKAYDLRSKFVHEGLTKTKYLNIKTIVMRDFVKEMMKSYFEKICF